ncbi:uncharacterized protein LOC126734740 isoform X2 [Anthonomus grandis grandis]|uniref:uncharacterized protein LOC126734740 isoform X2 n=1 Tax=Anthonomus grandis grandis TaxID=2921223 RepID=UPI002166485E|nr:uncharacterized protein LOC126734740 isoform X2 [Anthonomus grandis grandis]
MDEFFAALWYNRPLTISSPGDKLKLVIQKDVLQFCARHHIFALGYFQNSYKSERGIIFNTIEDFNPQLPVSVFIGALSDALPAGFLVLVLCPDELLVKWHYYMTWCSLLEIHVITDEEDLINICPESNTVLLIGFSNIKLAQLLIEQGYMFQSVIIDKVDEVATKLITRKLHGKFNIGITYRNFYTCPDQKLQWSILNWSNPGKVGKLSDFYEDNYKDFWARMCWDFCDTFKQPSVKREKKLLQLLKNWAKKHHLPLQLTSPKLALNKKRKIVEVISSSDSGSEELVEKSGRNNYASGVDTSVEKSEELEEKVEDVSVKSSSSLKAEVSIDTDSLSSTEEDLMSLIGIIPKKSTKKSSLKHNKSIIDDLLESSDISDKPGLSYVQLQKSEQTILSAENDFLKDLPTQVDKNLNNNDANVSSHVLDFDVDSLVSEVMEIAKK